jgi:hypothetical protein
MNDEAGGCRKREVRGSEIRLERVRGTEFGGGALVGAGATLGRKFIELSCVQIVFAVDQTTRAAL